MRDFYIDSGSLKDINQILEIYPELQKALGTPARFKVVLDANLAAADLVEKHKRPKVIRTAIEECARAQTLEVYAPLCLEEEMINSAIPNIARAKKIDPKLLFELWAEYRKMLIWDETIIDPDDIAPDCADPDDLPYILLEEKIGAVGILSRDKHIAAMGGSPLELEFALSVRRYSRAASVHLNIYVNGTLISVIGFAAIRALLVLAKDAFMALPPAIRTFIIIGLASALIHPGSRKWILEKLAVMKDMGAAAWPEILELMELATEKQLEAANELEKVSDIIEQKKPAAVS